MHYLLLAISSLAAPLQRPSRWRRRCNPATTIPFAVPVEAGDVDSTIYNTLGQSVRQVWNGPPANESRGKPRKSRGSPRKVVESLALTARWCLIESPVL